MKWDGTSFDISPETEPSFPAFAPIVSNAFDSMKDAPDLLRIGAGSLIAEQGAIPDYVWLLRSGLVKLTHVTPEGRETTLGLRASGWFAGAASVITQSPSIYSVRTIVPCSVSRVPAAEFTNWLMGSARMMRHFMTTVCREMISQSAAQAHLMASTAEDRLAHFMQERSARHPDVHTLDALPLLKQMELAQLLSITPEHLSRLLARAGAPRRPYYDMVHAAHL